MIRPEPQLRLPPQNLVAEVGVLGSILLDNDAVHLPEVARLRPEDFYRAAHEVIFRAVRGLTDRGVPVDTITLAEDLQTSDLLDEAGGIEAIAAIVADTPHSANAAYYADIVRAKSLARALAAGASETLNEVYANTLTSDDLLDRAASRLHAVADSATASDDVAGIGDGVADLLDRIESKRRGVTGLAYPWSDLNAATSGMHPDQLIVLASRPGVGKSAMALNVVQSVCLTSHKAALFVTLEMGKHEVRDRFACLRAGVNSRHLVETSLITPDEEHRLASVLAEMVDMPMVVDATPSRTVSQIGSQARMVTLGRRPCTRGFDLGLVVVDYLQLVDPEDPRDQRQEQVAKMSRAFKQMARRLHVPVMLLSQLNRKVEDRQDREPRLSDLRESGAIEQDADVVLFLHRPDMYRPDEMPGQAKLILAKNRNGPTATHVLDCDKATFRFTDPLYRVAPVPYLPPPDAGYGGAEF